MMAQRISLRFFRIPEEVLCVHFGPHSNSTLGRWLVILLDIMLVGILLLLDELLLEQDQHC